MYKKILVPLDGSQLAEAVLPHAEALAKSEGAEIVLLSVAVTPSLEFLARSPGLANKVIEDTEIETESYLELKVANLQKSWHQGDQYHARRSHPRYDPESRG
jgi:nucleotide-binding universal stress UspA family protein